MIKTFKLPIINDDDEELKTKKHQELRLGND